MRNQLLSEGFSQQDNTFTKEVKGGKVEIVLTNNLTPLSLIRNDTKTRLCLLLDVEDKSFLDPKAGFVIKNWKGTKFAELLQRLNILDLEGPLPCFHLFKNTNR